MSSYTCMRKSLCCINLLFLVLSCGIIWLNIAYRGYTKVLVSNDLLSGDCLLNNAGILGLMFFFLGCGGAWFQNRCILKMYFSMLIFALIMEFIAGTLGFVFRKNIEETLQKEILSGIQDRYTVDNHNGLKETWDTVQEKFKCCGVHNYQDWHHISAWPDKEWVPSSCCLPRFLNATTCGEIGDVSIIFSSGCYPKIHTWLMERLYIVGIVLMVVTAIQLFGVIATLIIICSLGVKKRMP